MELVVKDSSIELIRGDITQMETEAIVNAANTSLLGGGGVDGAIHRAGGKAILEECMKIRNQQGGCPVGEAVVTTAGKLPSRYVIHTVGPVWNGGMNQEEDKLRNCYRNALLQAEEKGVSSIAFPNISTGIYRYPKDSACFIALGEVFRYLSENDTSIKKVIFVCFDEENLDFYKKEFKKYEA
ncbi:O-acetyl-ADP-ribose deacetylase [Paenibacillus sp. FSL K6-1217]|uniref:O-acetyl-ADP-ribose deacetylase n=1 Tax=Paenibacillus sp. FSL K6-1217 TaxID=2921466 RepID=UPI00324E3893